MSGGEQPSFTTLAVGDVDEIIKFPKAKFVYEEPEEFKEHAEVMAAHVAVEADNKEEFLRLLQSPGVQKEKELICGAIFMSGAVKCATAVIDGETNGIISPDFGCGLAEGQFGVMHRSASYVNLRLVSLFLQRGFPADTRADSEYLNLKNALPLNVALRQIRYLFLRNFWDSHNWSATNLLMELGQMSHMLEAVRLLALNTREFKHEFFKYVEDGKMAEVGAFLLGAGDKLMPLCISEEDIVFNSFKDIIHYLQDKKTWWTMSYDEFREMRETLSLLDIYDKIGNQLTAYAGNTENDDEDPKSEVAKLLEAAGIDVNIKDLDFQGSVNRLSSSSYKGRVPQIYAPGEHDKLLWMQSQQPSIPTRHLFHTSSSGNIDSKYASLTVANKAVNVMQDLNSCKRWISFMTIFRRGVRRV